MTPSVSSHLTQKWPLGAILCVLAVFEAGCGQSPSAPAPASPAVSPAPLAAKTTVVAISPPVPAAPGPLRFEDITKASGIDFVHFSGMTKDRHYPTANGSGVAILDYDGDGKMDLYFASCNLLAGLNATCDPIGVDKGLKGRNALYRNLGNGKFEDVTSKSGLGYRGFCHGIIAGDLDNDGDTDVILCNYGPNVLFLNNGDGTFKDVSQSSGLAVSNWSSGGALLDFDNDGDLDIYITNYGVWDIKTDGERWCGNQELKIRQYCAPGSIAPTRHFLYRNNGVNKDGVPQFTDVTEAAGIARNGKDHWAHGFGVIAADLNGDGKIDIYVGNDQNPSFLFLNLGGGKFQDATDTCGASLSARGATESGMGVDAEDIDGDGRPELIRTNFLKETTSVYQNLGEGNFIEQSAYLGVGAVTKGYVKWGCGLIDFDNDGWPDIFVTNGHVDDNHELVGNPNQPYAQPPYLLHNVTKEEGRWFNSVAAGAGPYFTTDHVGRGAAFGDLSDDGKPDIVVNHKDAAPAVLLNVSPTANHWIRLVLQGTKSNRDAIGARVDVVANTKTIYRQKKSGGSLESMNDPRLLIGVGPATDVKVTIKWPSGLETVLDHLEVDKTHKVVEGKGLDHLTLKSNDDVAR